MPRETREERAVRGMVPQLNEHLVELKGLANSPTRESDSEAWCLSLLKQVLGFSASAGFTAKSQEAHGRLRFDLVVTRADKPDKKVLVAEIKKLGVDLNKSDLRSGKAQLAEYLKSLGNVRWGILTNGYEWRLYDFKSDFITVTSTDLRNEQHELDTSPRALDETAWDLLDFTAMYFSSGMWEEMSAEAQALSPDSLARSILSTEVVKHIGKVLKEHRDYRVPLDVLTDKLAELLEFGLNDMLACWNEVQRGELDRYIRSQKKLAKKTKRGVQSAPAIPHEESLPGTAESPRRE